MTLFNSPFNFTLFSSSLPSYVILANGLVLAVGSMMLRSFRNLSGVRETLLNRGALRPEVDSVLHRNALFIATIVAVSAAAAASVAAIAPSVKPVITDMARPSAYSYLILALLAILAISVTPTMYLLRRS